MPNAEVVEAEVTKLVSYGGLKPETMCQSWSEQTTPKQLKWFKTETTM